MFFLLICFVSFCVEFDYMCLCNCFQIDPFKYILYIVSYMSENESTFISTQLFVFHNITINKKKKNCKFSCFELFRKDTSLNQNKNTNLLKNYSVILDIFSSLLVFFHNFFNGVIHLTHKIWRYSSSAT